MIRFLTQDVILAIHEDQIRLYGGSYEMRDAGAFDSAINMPKAQFDGHFLHSTIFHMAAAYGFHLCQNHPFIDGNKRTAGMVMFVFLKLNKLEPTATEMEYYTTMMDIACGVMDKASLTEWIRTVVKGEPPTVE